MKRYVSYHLLALLIIVFAACEDVEDNAIPNIAAPVLVEIETLGKYTPLDQVTIATTISDLDKTGILDNTVGIDTVPASLSSIQVLKDVGGTTETFFSPLSLTQGSGVIVADWADILPADSAPEDGLEVAFEYFETYENVPFRKIYKLDYSTTAFTGNLPVYTTTVEGSEVELPIAADEQTYTFSYELISVDQTGVDITIEQQLNDNDFITLTPPAGEWPATGTLPYVGSDYTSGDIVTVRITGTKGELVSSQLFTFTVE